MLWAFAEFAGLSSIDDKLLQVQASLTPDQIKLCELWRDFWMKHIVEAISSEKALKKIHKPATLEIFWLWLMYHIFEAAVSVVQKEALSINLYAEADLTPILYQALEKAWIHRDDISIWFPWPNRWVYINLKGLD